MSSLLCARARSSHAFLVFATLLALLAPESRGQIFDESTSLSTANAALNARLLPSIEGDPLALEGPIDAESYLVGPGDVFTFTIGGSVPLTQRARVSADGTLIVPGVGSFDVADRPLAAVQTEVRAALARVYRNVSTDAALTEPRRFYVHVSGAVIEPGRHILMPIARVEDALASAMAGVSPQRVLGLPPTRQAMTLRAIQAINPAAFEPNRVQPVEGLVAEGDYRPAFRNVLVTHRDGTTSRVDLLRYYATGTPEANPYLRDGDTIFLPFYDPATESVGVDGAVPEPGVFDHRPDDTVLALLQIALGPEATQHAGSVRLVRADASAAERVFVVDAADWATTPVYAGDRLFVLDRPTARGMAAIEGAVAYPGRYPIHPGTTTLRELVTLAGGLRPDALLRGAYLERGTSDAASSEGFDRNRLAFNPLLEASTREAALGESLYEYARRSGLDFSGRLYLTRELLSTRRVSANLDAILQGSAADITLRNGDRLVVPVDLGAVAVVGQVTRPGYVPFVAGRSVEHYITEAGGRTVGATEAYVLDASTGAIVASEEAATLKEGDLVFVDRIPSGDDRISQQVIAQERSVAVAERREDADRRFRALSVALTAISTTVTVIALLTSLGGGQ